MPTLGTQNIATSYPQLLKTFGTGGVDGNLQVITDGDNTSSALSLSTTGISSTGSLSVDGTSLLTGAVTFGTSLTASTGTATIGTLSASTATISTATISTATVSTATISTATIPNILGATTFGSSLTASTGTATIGTLSASTATISTATIPTILGETTFATGITSSSGTNTLGTINVNTATVGTMNTLNGISVTTIATTGTLQIGASGPKLTAVSYGTAAFTSATAPQYNAAQTTNGTFALTGAALGDIVIGTINSIGSATGTVSLSHSFHVVSSGVARYVVDNGGATAGTIPAGTIFATALRYTA